MSLDVTESTVSFKPRGGGRPRMVRAGRGLTAPTRGQPVERAVTPVTRGRINRTNDRATTSTSDYSLGYVTKAMEKATRERPPRKEEDRRRSRQEDEQIPEEPGPAEPAPEEPEEPTPPGNEDAQPGGEPANEGGRPDREPQGNNPGAKQENPNLETGGSGSQAGGGRKSVNLPPVAANLPIKTERPRANEILEHTPDIKQARKTG